MPERDSGWVGGSVVDAEDARLATASLAAPGKTPTQARSGLRPAPGDPGLVRATPTASGSVTVQPFQAVIQGTRHSATGAYLATLDEQKTINVLKVPAHASYGRFDIVVARQTDVQYGDPASGFVVDVVAGTAASTPTEPAVPGDAIKLARIAVRAGTSAIIGADITDLRPFTSAVGGVLPVRSAAERPVDAYPGMYVHRLDTNKLESWDGSAWRTLMVEDDTGWLPVTVAANWDPTSPDPSQDGKVSLRRIGQVVHLRGGLTRRNTPAGHGTLILTLPQAYRPQWMHHWPGNTFGGYALRSHQFLDLSLATNGELNMWTDNDVPVPVGETIYVNTTYLLG